MVILSSVTKSKSVKVLLVLEFVSLEPVFDGKRKLHPDNRSEPNIKNEAIKPTLFFIANSLNGKKP